ncbi:hypothetical protein BJF92_05550 [Rhizobium rhizosphaerae]|uniref:Cell division and transport-associated protein TolA n=1 Tax=Xaviernesmea rhizosphaerae TaxID=1672749 RepID=A0A1Q9AFA3_9HYPH|nr:hypothetical protein [Xaviernesmea rhizosphaerae]OLP53618.1 hypothetical protein BJF92_05550 [Xaviernesmea rhizosphaerae]
MRGSLATSAALHVLVLAWALISLGSPAHFEVSDTEAMPVDIVPVEELTQIQQGEKTAPKAEKSAPAPTKRPDVVENAENMGDNSVDLKTPPRPSVKPVEKEASAAPKATETPVPTPEPTPQDKPDLVDEKPPATPATEVAALPAPKAEVTPQPRPEPPKPEAKTETPPPPQEQPEQAEEKPAEKPDAEALPDKVPAPMAKPKVEPKPEPPKPVEQAKTTPPAQTAKTPDRKADEGKKESKKSASSKQSDFNADEIASLLNKQESSGGGAKRSTQTAALGGKKATGGSTLSQSDKDAIKQQIQNNWSIIPGIADTAGILIKVTLHLDRDGNIIGQPEISASGGSDSARRTHEGGVRRAIMKSLPLKGLPPDKYDDWSEMVLNFDPSEMGF